MWRNSFERRRGYGGGWAQGGRRPFRRGDYNREPPSWKSRQGGGRSAPAWKQAPKFTSAKSGNKRPLGRTAEAQAKKRQKSNHAQIDLTTIILARQGNNEGEMPELVSSRFYDCTQEAKIGKNSYFLRINISRKGGKKKYQDEDPNPDDRISIPVPLDSVEGISVLSGMNPCEDLLKAYSDRFALKASIEHWKKIIAQRTESYETNQTKLQELPEIEEEPEVEAEADEKDSEEIQSEKINENEGEDESNEPEAADGSQSQDQEESEDEELRKVKEEEEKLQKEEKEREAKAILEAKKKRETARKRRNTLEAVVGKLQASLEKAQQSLTSEEEKLEDLVNKFGEWLAYFEDGMDEKEATSYFQNELKETYEPIVEDEEAEKVESTAMNMMLNVQVTDQMDEDDADDSDAAEKVEADKGSENEDKETEPGDCHACGEEGAARHKFCDICGAKQKQKPQKEKKEQKAEKPQKPAEPEFSDITDVPVWISILLKKPLEKFYASAVKNSICQKDVLEKVSLILLKYHPKHKSKIVLKNVTYKGAEEDLKILTQVVKGPWKSIRKKPSELLKGKVPYSLNNIVQYLAKTHQRQKVLDTHVDNCTLCDASIKRMFMDKHMTQFCQKRHEPCNYCDEPLVVENMKEHLEKDCHKFPVPCPLKCFSKYERDMLEEHQKTCKNAIVQCEFWNFGCHSDLKRKQLTRHMKEAGVEHVKLLKARLELLTGYLGEQEGTALTDLLYQVPVVQEEEEENEVEEDIENEMETEYAGDN